MIILNDVSEAFAIYSLMVSYKTLKEELKPSQPVGKFFCMKLVIFLTCWQAVAIAGMKKWHVISKAPPETGQRQ